ncbi:MAG: sigma-70 family RNA polymerase sigma factor [Leptolyngbyaceae cyanobacterium bins.349]|nr:sigma-70 family RNA polymerase sigma factor [Leptolyngbyaceae cyanobacterium bins.349]
MDKTKDELDAQLKQLARIAQQHPPTALERRSALRQLVNGILASGRLCHPQRGRFVGLYEEIYDEAVQDLLLYVCQNIHKYDAERATVIAWVNVLLERRFFREAIPKVMGRQDTRGMELADLDRLVCNSPSPTATELMRECLEADPDRLFQQEHIEHQPQANFQTLALRRLAGESWKEIAADLEIKVSTVSSFYCRCVAKFTEYLKAYCTPED